MSNYFNSTGQGKVFSKYIMYITVKQLNSHKTVTNIQSIFLSIYLKGKAKKNVSKNSKCFTVERVI